MIIASNEKVPLEKCPALVLNADFRPLSYYPLSLWCWQDAVKSVFLNRVSIVSNYKRKIRSPSFEMSLPSVIALKNFIKPSEHPNFTRFNVFLRDKFTCQYCGENKDDVKLVEKNASLNVKRSVIFPNEDWKKNTSQGPYHILKTQEIKTIWHPVGA